MLIVILYIWIYIIYWYVSVIIYVKWIEDQRKIGNECFKNGDLEKALDEYMKCLCALDFRSCRGYVDELKGLKDSDKSLPKSKHITPEREKMA